MRKRKMRLLAGLISLAMAAGALSACGSQNQPGAGSGSGGSGANPATQNTSASAQAGGASSLQPSTQKKGEGNTVSNLLAGGRYVTDGSKLFVVDYKNAYLLSYINSDGMPTDFGASKEGIVGYLNIWDGHLYYMTYGSQKGVRRSVNANYKGYNIYRKAINEFKDEELVASGVSDYGTGFYIANGILYYNSDDKAMVTVDLTSQGLPSKSDKDKVLIAANEQAVYYADRSTGAGMCSYKENGEDKEFSIGKVFSSTNFNLPATDDNRYAIAIDGLNYYFVDAMLETTTLKKASPAGTEIVVNLTNNDHDYATGIFANQGILYCSLGHYDGKSYINSEIELDGLFKLEGQEFVKLDVVQKNSHIQFIDDNIKDLCIYSANGSYYGTGLAGGATDSFGFSQQNQIMYQPDKKTISKSVVRISHEENIP